MMLVASCRERVNALLATAPPDMPQGEIDRLRHELMVSLLREEM